VGRILLILRLVVRDLRRRPAEAALVILVIAVATTAVTIGLALYGVTDKPYQQTRAATAGPDVVASVPLGSGRSASVNALIHASGVTGHAGPYPLAATTIRAGGRTADVMAEGRDLASASVDQPKPTRGGWVRDGGVVIERGFADALDVHLGDQVSLGGRSFRVVGTAVTAGLPSYPGSLCDMGCASIPGSWGDSSRIHTPGLVWLTKPAARSLATSAGSLSYLLDLKLANPAGAEAFVTEHGANWSPAKPVLSPWQKILDVDNLMVENEQQAMQVGGWLFALLSGAGLAVLIGRRMAEQTRRVGLLKAVGATPGLIASVLLAEHLALALLATAVGLVAGRLAAPLLTSTGAGLIGTPGAPSLTVSTVVFVGAMALAVALAATLVPAIRAARTSTVNALADAARAPRRRAWLIAISTRLPAPLLLGLRVAARRPRRSVLNAFSIAVTVTGIVTILSDYDFHQAFSSAVGNPRIDRIVEMMLIITVMLVGLAAVNLISITWATVLDARHSSALARALGATPQQVTAGLSAVQLLPALPATIVGIPAGIYLCDIFRHGNLAVPPLGWLLLVLLGTPLAVTALTIIPSRLATHRPVAETLKSELT
jgi:putative ABC transport system permease protein